MDQTLTILASLPGTKQEEQCPSVVCDINIYLRFYTLLIFTPSVTGECPGSGLTVTNQKRVLTILTNQSRVFSDGQWQAGGWLAQRWKCHLVSASRCGSPSGQLIAASHWSANCSFSLVKGIRIKNLHWSILPPKLLQNNIQKTYDHLKHLHHNNTEILCICWCIS